LYYTHRREKVVADTINRVPNGRTDRVLDLYGFSHPAQFEIPSYVHVYSAQQVGIVVVRISFIFILFIL
jgi:hypothetical protein